jgi:hypothetical protein
MRRSRLLLLLAVLLVLVPALYSAAWYVVDGRVREALQDWAEARRVEGLKVGWDRYEIAGFPFAIRVTIEQPVYGKGDAAPGFEATAPRLIGTARPWSLRRWRVTAPSGVHLVIEPATARPQLTLDAAALEVTTGPSEPRSSPGATAIALAVDGLTLVGDGRLAIAHAEARTILPPKAGASHRETWVAGEIVLDSVTLPTEIPPLGRSVDRLAAELSIKGEIPPGQRRPALARWRQDGGTLEVESLDLVWKSLQVSATGTLALDADLQPEGALTAAIRGYGEIIDALVAADTVKAGDAAVAKIALGLLAKPGADGVSRVTAPLSLQNRQLFLGPARLARLPNFTWE